MEIRSVVAVVIVMQIPININSLSINKLTDQPKFRRFGRWFERIVFETLCHFKGLLTKTRMM